MNYTTDQKKMLRLAIEQELQKPVTSTQDAIRHKMLEDSLRDDFFDDDPACHDVAVKYGII